MEKVIIKSEFIRLDAALKLKNLVSSGGMAKVLIKNGEVSVNGEVCIMRTKKLRKGDKFAFSGNEYIVENEN